MTSGNKRAKMGNKAIQRPVAVAETDVEQRPWTTTTSLGRPISIAESIRNLKPGQSFRIDDHNWRRRITATASYLGIKVSTSRLQDDRLLITRLKEK
jgi:hypothetical protein